MSYADKNGDGCRLRSCVGVTRTLVSNEAHYWTLSTRHEIGQRGRICTCGHPVPSRACCCYTTRWVSPMRVRASGIFVVGKRNPATLLAGFRGWIFSLREKIEIKRAGSIIHLPARAISTKNKHLLVIYAIPTRGFTAAVSVFRGTPPAKPLDCKFQC